MHSLLRGGAEHVFAQLINQLSNRYEIHVFLLHNGIDYTIPENVKVIGLKEKLFESTVKSYMRLPFIALKVYKYCKTNDIKVRISVLNRPGYVNTFLSVFFRLKGRSIVCERSNQTKFIELVAKQNLPLKYILTNLMASTYNNADLVLVNSQLSASEIIHAFNCKKQVNVIYNPVNIDKIAAMAIAEPTFNFEKDSKYIIGVGVFRAEKNWPMLIKSLSLIEDKQIKLVLVGYGNKVEEKKLVDLVQELGMSDRILFAGMQENPYQYIKRAYALVLCSLLEGFPNVILEALAVGTPVIATDCRSGPREILAPSTDPLQEVKDTIELAEYGILCPVDKEQWLAEAIKKLCYDKGLYAQYAQKAILRATEFEIHKIAQQYGDAFSSLPLE